MGAYNYQSRVRYTGAHAVRKGRREGIAKQVKSSLPHLPANDEGDESLLAEFSIL